MKEEEAGDYQAERGCQEIGCDEIVGKFRLYAVIRKDRCEKGPSCDDQEGDCGRAIEQHVHEILVVVEADTIGYPRAMMIHFQNALITLGAMMATVGL